jgi:hypothetical protein
MNLSYSKNVLIVSKKFHAGHWSHIKAVQLLLVELNYNVRFLINKNYSRNDFDPKVDIIGSIKSLKLMDIDIVFFLFPSIDNLFIGLRFRLFSRAKLIYLFHEPILSFNQFKVVGFRLTQLFRLYLIDSSSRLMCKICHLILLPSNIALNTYSENYIRCNKNFLRVPLIFLDETVTGKLNQDVCRNCISYIGTIAPDHAFNKFVDFIYKVMEDDLLPDINFQIATSSLVDIGVLQKLDKYLLNGRLSIKHGEWLTNAEINYYYNKSFLIWNAYDRTSQSGVLPKAFMFGVPILGNIKLSNEFLIDYVNGIYLHDNSDFIEILNAVNVIFVNQLSYTSNSRKSFLHHFYYKNYVSFFKDILK